MIAHRSTMSPVAEPQLVQRSCGCDGSCESCAKKRIQRQATGGSRSSTPLSAGVPDLLRSSGVPLENDVRGSMERLFGHDFSRVRVHQDGAVAASADALGAEAYTTGQHIAFGANAYEPHSRDGRQLLAHELAHTVQQRRSSTSLEIDDESSAAEVEAEHAADSVAADRPVAEIHQSAVGISRRPRRSRRPATPREPECGRRRTVRVAGFNGSARGAHISHIEVDIKAHAHSDVTLTWTNLPPGTPVPGNPLHGSPGAGRCSMVFPGDRRPRPVDCSNVADSNTDDSFCTPIGDFGIQGHACSLRDDTRATRVSWFKRERAVAFHNFPTVPPRPASHGCVRMATVTVGGVTAGGGDWIHDNTIAGTTTVRVTRPAGDPGPRCWATKDRGQARPNYTPPAPTNRSRSGGGTDTSPKTGATTQEPNAALEAPDAGGSAADEDVGSAQTAAPAAEGTSHEPGETAAGAEEEEAPEEPEETA